jgi:hypothetical protein
MPCETDEEIKALLDALFLKHDKDESNSIDASESKFLFAELLVQEFGISVVEEFGDNVEQKFADYFKQADLN